MYSRAQRLTQQSAAYTTPDVVGPGSYLRTDRGPTVHSYAPFSSTAERPGIDELAKGVAPGPGAYATNLPGMQSGAGAAFASKVVRLQASQTKAVPGPGQYTLRDEWREIQHNAAAVNSAPPQRRATAAKVPNPPSIPTTDQSFGYEETHDGDLRMQKPPAGGYTGVSGRASVGPGEYDPTRATAYTKKAGAAISFGNSRVQRALYSENVDTPGPGTYARDDSDARARPSANFLSRVPLSYQKLLDPEKLVPGPGSYVMPPSITPKAVPENLQAFGSTQKRLASDAITPAERQRMAQPGPGAYDARKTDFVPKPKAGGAGSHSAADAAAANSGFNSSTVRFAPLSKSGKPGPGAYDELDQHSFIANMSRKTHGRNGVFGSTTRRFHSLKQDRVPGAGSYDPVSARESEARREDGPSSAFASGVQRFTKSAPTRISAKSTKVKDHVPPPWQYNPRPANDWAGAARAPSTFGSTIERFPAGEIGGGVRILQGPGPGQYAPKDPREGFRKQQSTSTSFGTKEGRFGAPARGIFSGSGATPGPGQYESSIENQDPLIKRSFNITIG